MKKVFIRAKGRDQVEAAINYLESLGCTGGWYDRENVPSISEAIVGDWKGDISWAADIDYLVNGGYQEIFIPTKHKHHDLIMAWAADPSQKVWYNGLGDDWRPVEISPSWRYEYDWYIGEHPPKRKIKIGDVEIDAPEVACLTHGDAYFLPNLILPELHSESRWTNDHYDSDRIKRGQIHLNKEAAIAHAKALIKVSGGCVDE